jgi:hypothetical protein
MKTLLALLALPLLIIGEVLGWNDEINDEIEEIAYL